MYLFEAHRQTFRTKLSVWGSWTNIHKMYLFEVHRQTFTKRYVWGSWTNIRNKKKKPLSVSGSNFRDGWEAALIDKKPTPTELGGWTNIHKTYLFEVHGLTFTERICLFEVHGLTFTERICLRLIDKHSAQNYLFEVHRQTFTKRYVWCSWANIHKTYVCLRFMG